jgi:hypothetical protein
MRDIKEDNNGFVYFPIMDNSIKRINGKTLVYIVAFDEKSDYILSNNQLNIPGRYMTDDITGRCIYLNSDMEEEFENIPSISVVSSICIGWSILTFKREDEHWYATFSDLTSEGRKLYYSIKKLHNNKEVRILTFNEVF